MATRVVEWKKPYTWWKAISIDENKVISLNLRDENNLIIYDEWDDEIYVDLQLDDEITPTDAFPIWVNVGRVIVDNWWDKPWTIISAVTTSGDNIKIFYADEWTLWIDNWTGTFKQIYFKSDVDALLLALRNYIDWELAKKQNWVSSDTAPENPSEWDLWYDTTNDELKVYDGTNWNATWWWSDIIYATQAEYNALLPWALTDNKHYFIYTGSWPTPWPQYSPDITTAIQDQNIRPISISNQRTLSISNDGYHILLTNEDWPVYEYTLSTPRDLTSTITSQTANLKNQTYTDFVGYWNDGQYLYISNSDQGAEGSYGTIIQYELSTPYDISTAWSIIHSFDTSTISSNNTRVCWIRFYDNGTKIMGSTRDCVIFSATLSTAWDISTLWNWTVQIAVLTIFHLSDWFALSPDWRNWYVTAYHSGDIVQISTTTPYDFSTYTTSTRSAPSGAYNFWVDVSPDWHYLFLWKQNWTIYRYSFQEL